MKAHVIETTFGKVTSLQSTKMKNPMDWQKISTNEVISFIRYWACGIIWSPILHALFGPVS